MFKETLTRRGMMIGAATLAGAAALQRSGLAFADALSPADENPQPPAEAGRDYTPVITPNGSTLPFKIVDGVKVFHLIVEEVQHEFAPGLVATCWGYNGSVHGPTIEAVEGDRVRIYVTNRLSEPTTVHWHSVLLPSGMDGVAGLSQPAIKPGETFRYEFVLRQHGTFMYHSHHDEMTQMGMGLLGMIVIHPRNVSPQDRPDRDFVLMMSEWRIDPGTSRPNPSEMTDFNILTFNGKCFPATDALVAKLGDKVRIRLGNLSAMEHHPIHLHGYHFNIIGTGAGDIPQSIQERDSTVLVPVGSTRTIQFIADNPGDWAFHCHMSHHVMNQMGHGSPNMIGVKTDGLDEKINRVLPSYMTMGADGMGDMGQMNMGSPANSIPMVGGDGPYGYITMGGMFTIFKVRENLKNYADSGTYTPPAGTLAQVASTDELRRDGIVQ
jgi:FtsP/CotA-like multicopper oxidase with cupredoxin domain